MSREDVLSQLLDEELESEAMLAQRLSSSPPQALPLTHGLTPLRKPHRTAAAQDGIPLKPSVVVLSKRPLSELISPPTSARSESTLTPSGST